MKYQVLFSLKNKEKVFILMSSAAVIIGDLRVNLHLSSKNLLCENSSFLNFGTSLNFILTKICNNYLTSKNILFENPSSLSFIFKRRVKQR